MFTLYPLQTDVTSRYGLDWEKGSLSEKVACLVSEKREEEVRNAGPPDSVGKMEGVPIVT